MDKEHHFSRMFLGTKLLAFFNILFGLLGIYVLFVKKLGFIEHFRAPLDPLNLILISKDIFDVMLALCLVSGLSLLLLKKWAGRLTKIISLVIVVLFHIFAIGVLVYLKGKGISVIMFLWAIFTGYFGLNFYYFSRVKVKAQFI